MDLKKLDQTEIIELKKTALEIRKNIIKMLNNANSGHPGGGLSAVDILTVLYSKVMQNFKEWDKHPDFNKRDRFILSKGHASTALYAVLAECGYFDKEELMTFRKFGSRLQGHPSYGFLPGIEVSTGSLGQGLSIACGVAMGLKLDNLDSKVFVLMGDGELQEGNIWEGAMNAAHNNLCNIVGIVDRNCLQIDGHTECVKSLKDLAAKWASFGWNVVEADGHDVEFVYEALQKAIITGEKTSSPSVVIATTIKGKGVSFMENNVDWHGKAPNDNQMKEALEELEKVETNANR